MNWMGYYNYYNFVYVLKNSVPILNKSKYVNIFDFYSGTLVFFKYINAYAYLV